MSTKVRNKSIAVDSIRLDGGTQVRSAINTDTVKEYADLIEAGESFPPPVVFFDGAYYWIGDGFHRLGAFRALKKERITVEVHEGTCDDAKWYATSANKGHGLQMKPRDRKNAIIVVLSHVNGKDMSNSDIASHVGTTDRYVREVRKQLEDAGEIERQKPLKELAAEALADPANEGKSNRQIAKEIGVDPETVNKASRAENRNSSENRHEDSPTKSAASDEPTDPEDDIDLEDPTEDFEFPESDAAMGGMFKIRLENLDVSIGELAERWPDSSSRAVLLKVLQKWTKKLTN